MAATDTINFWTRFCNIAPPATLLNVTMQPVLCDDGVNYIGLYTELGADTAPTCAQYKSGWKITTGADSGGNIPLISIHLSRNSGGTPSPVVIQDGLVIRYSLAFTADMPPPNLRIGLFSAANNVLDSVSVGAVFAFFSVSGGGVHLRAYTPMAGAVWNVVAPDFPVPTGSAEDDEYIIDLAFVVRRNDINATATPWQFDIELYARSKILGNDAGRNWLCLGCTRVDFATIAGFDATHGYIYPGLYLLSSAASQSFVLHEAMYGVAGTAAASGLDPSAVSPHKLCLQDLHDGLVTQGYGGGLLACSAAISGGNLCALFATSITEVYNAVLKVATDQVAGQTWSRGRAWSVTDLFRYDDIPYAALNLKYSGTSSYGTVWITTVNNGDKWLQLYDTTGTHPVQIAGHADAFGEKTGETMAWLPAWIADQCDGHWTCTAGTDTYGGAARATSRRPGC